MCKIYIRTKKQIQEEINNKITIDDRFVLRNIIYYLNVNVVIHICFKFGNKSSNFLYFSFYAFIYSYTLYCFLLNLLLLRFRTTSGFLFFPLLNFLILSLQTYRDVYELWLKPYSLFRTHCLLFLK